MKPHIELYLMTTAIVNIRGRWAYTEQDQLIIQLTKLRPDNPNYVERFLAICPFKTIIIAVPNSTPSPMLKFEKVLIKWEKSVTNHTSSNIKWLDQLLAEAKLNNQMQKDKTPNQSLYNWFLTTNNLFGVFSLLKKKHQNSQTRIILIN